MDWDDLRIFLELARTQRLMAAAERLGIDHSTVSRRVRRFERTLGTRLFERSNRGYTLTPQGARLAEHAVRINADLQAACDDVLDGNAALSGAVRLGATEAFGTFVVAPQIAHFCNQHPAITVDLVLAPRFVSLARHEADVVITLEPPKGDGYVVSRLTDYRLRVYATAGYLRRHPPIRQRSDLANHPIFGYVDDLVFSDELLYLRQIAPSAHSPLRSTSVIAQYTAACQGMGLAILPCFLARHSPELRPVLAAEDDLTRTFWLATPREHRHLARVDALWRYLTDMVERLRPDLMDEAEPPGAGRRPTSPRAGGGRSSPSSRHPG